MTLLTRLRVVPALLAVAAASVSIGTSLFGDFRGGTAKTAVPVENPNARPVAEDLAVTKFTNLPALTYKSTTGDTLFAWQVKPELAAAPARPRDILVVVDTSASQAGRPLQQARQIIIGLAGALAADDRVSVWTANTPAATRNLTKDFQPATSDDVKAAAAALTETEYGSGATDLKGALAKALGTVAPNRGRQQLVLFLGDGDSSYDPINESDRVALGGRMEQSDVFFFAVPLGVKVNANNLHGLAALTGGTVVRVQEDLANVSKRGEFVARLKTALDVPVLKPESVKFGADVAETFPSKLPPLRADKATLVIGKLAKAAPRVTAEVKGVVGTRAVTLSLGHDLPAPLPEHFFLNLMFAQWRDAPHKDAPAMLQADRALALASTQISLYREEYITQATWAVSLNKLDDATKLYEAAAKIDPSNTEVATGLALVGRMKTGQITKADMDKRAAAKVEGLKIDKAGAVRMVIQEGAKEPAAQPPAGGQPGLTPRAQTDLIQEAADLKRVEEQRYRVLVDATIRRARENLKVDPDGAYAELKRQRDDIQAYAGIGDAARGRYVSDLTAVMQEIFLKGAEIKRQAAAERDQIAKTRQRLNEFDRQQAEEDRTKARIDAFRQLMQQARYELAYQEAQLMIQERVSRGQTVPSTAVASYIIGQHATQLREWRELVRIREDRFLLTMMQAEKSHIPYPDEPPVHFPPAAVWRQLTEGDGQRPGRRDRYGNTALGAQPSPSMLRLRSIIEDGLPVELQGKDLKTTPLQEVLADLSKRYEITFVINQNAPGMEGLDQSTANANKLSASTLNGLRLGTFLDVYLRGLSVPNITYVVRPDYIEITSYEARLTDKVTTTFAVADLVIPIPSAVNQATLQQTLGVQQQTLAIFGAASGAAQFLGGGNFLGVGGNGGAQPFGGGGAAPPGGGGGAGNPFFGGGQNGQGGIVGLGGNGGVGQFGNLGGQFGLQGGTQESLLIGVIVETVARGEWDARTMGLAGYSSQQNQAPGAEVEASFLDAKQQNSLGYYPPAHALIVRGTGKYLPYAGTKLEKVGGGMAAGPNPKVLVIGPNTPVAPKAVQPKAPAAVAAGTPAPKSGIVNPKNDAAQLAKSLDSNPKKKWNQAVEWTVTDPGLIVAAADFLMGFDEYGHAAEVLKAGMRKGLTTEAWTHGALHVALQMSNAAPEEVERAALSAIDLDPADPGAYIRAAKAEAELGNHDVAVALCRRAADRDPDQPAAYANALAYAEKARNVSPDTVEWAASSLLRRDFGQTDGVDYHGRVKELLPRFVARFDAAGTPTPGLRRTVTEQTQRDLTIELLWQGAADLDLTVTEPGGSVCTTLTPRSVGGGVLTGDRIEQTDDGRAEAYTAASAFSGVYRVTARTAFGRPVGNTATLKITRFKGTPRESHDLVTIDLGSATPVEVRLDGGSRTELAPVNPDVTTLRTAAMNDRAAVPTGTRGFGGGVAAAGSASTSAMGSAAGPDARLPLVVQPWDQVIRGTGASADIRATYRLNPDRQTYSVSAQPVFATGGRDVRLPRVSLLPGGGD
ncbi:VWA domain-containing protein [Urbifossiella limnaea]|uniref:von Willebrand factor type A domain protein n=1 Tax=Urbifossiella limnaea TaxID=2528023 RepID=A0A517Y2J3_9BACT|nr:VWA domain-containing protein [Urbifossiella limnaea]QDU23987.1 von Willebrand factor type A domain protein [Urbifossiella limnaea]